MEGGNPVRELLKEARDLLAKGGIYPVLNYGWQDEETPSDEFIGLAMWVTDAPFKPRYGIWDEPSPPPLPSARDEVLHRSGEDFLGTMDLALDALALALLCYEHRKPFPNMDGEELFWENHAATVLWLNIAADRLRDYFVMARFGISTKEFKARHKMNGIFARSFRLTGEGEGPLAEAASKKLVKLAERIGSFRRTRNDLVHEIASRRGKFALGALKLQRDEARKTPFVPRHFDTSREGLAALAGTSKLLADSKEAELLGSLVQLKEWYASLVMAGGLVFEFEYWKRVGK